MLKKWRHSIFIKFSAAFLLVGFIPLLSLSIFSLQAFTGHVEKFTSNNLKQMTLYTSYNINNFFADYDDITKLMYTGRYEGYSHTVSHNQTTNVNTLEQINNVPIDAFLRTILFSDKHIRSVYFRRTMDGKIYYKTRQSKPLLEDRLPIVTWGQTLIDRENQLAIIPTHQEDYYSNSNHQVITFGRNLIDISGNLTKNHKVVGSLFIDVDVEVLNKFLEELNLNPEDEIYVGDASGNIYYSNIENEPIEVIEHRFIQSSKNYLEFIDDITYIDGKLHIRVSEDMLYAQLTDTQTMIYIAIMICCIVLLIMGSLFSKKLAAPIRVVLQNMNKVEMGNLNVQINNYSKDELGRLAFGFNRMVERLKAFINDAYIAEIKQKQTELNALKSQIRPHYLYNTLEVIRMNAVVNDDNEVADMILSLSNQLKYVIDYGEDWVPLKSEISHLEDYFYILSVRYENRIELRISIESDVQLDYPILKLSIQPIVENAVQHGILPKGGKGSVLVSIEILDNKLVVTVYDDGVGIPSSRLQQLEQTLQQQTAPTKNVGLKNVHDRIQHLCGTEYGLQIRSVENVGTSVTLKLPIHIKNLN